MHKDCMETKNSTWELGAQTINAAHQQNVQGSLTNTTNCISDTEISSPMSQKRVASTSISVQEAGKSSDTVACVGASLAPSNRKVEEAYMAREATQLMTQTNVHLSCPGLLPTIPRYSYTLCTLHKHLKLIV